MKVIIWTVTHLLSYEGCCLMSRRHISEVVLLEHLNFDRSTRSTGQQLSGL